MEGAVHPLLDKVEADFAALFNVEVEESCG